MKKTTFPTGSTQQRWTDMNKMVSDFNTLEKNLRDLRTVLAAIAWQQDDKTLTVPVSALQTMPPGVELAVTFDRALDQYVFIASLPDTAPAAEGTGLAAHDPVTGLLR
jgi:hypothetical protein